MKIYTIGHSVHTKEEFIDMLAFAEIEVLVDIRAFPGSRIHPQLSKDKMKSWLPEAGYEYTHLPLLGGRKRQSELIQSDLNAAWNNQSFHNYADYTLTDEYQKGIDQLAGIA